MTPMTRSIVTLAVALATVGALPARSQVALVDEARGAVADDPQAIAARDGLPRFRTAVRAIGPSVVNVSTSRRVAVSTPGLRLGPGLFGHDGPFPFVQPHPRMLEQSSLGSGVIVTEDGYVLTNNHVVHGAGEITVTLQDGRAYEARVVGVDPATDVAVLKIDAEGLVAAEFAPPGSVAVGDWVLAVGNPFGLGHTVTSGIVSAKGRSGMGLTKYEDFIQTDAAINPGNSGGPLVDLAGRIVGVNTAIKSRTGGSLGIGFAIPADMARHVMTSLIEHGRVDRGWLGVYVQDLDEELAGSFGWDGTHGVLVAQVVPDSPAARAGLREGDIVVTVDGKAIASSNALVATVASYARGTQVRLEVFRDGRVRSVPVTIGRPGDEAGRTARRVLGMDVRSVTPSLARQHDLSVTEGAFVTEVEPGGLADRLGIRPGDVVLAVGDRRVDGADGFHEAVAAEDLERGIRLLVESGRARRYLLVR